MDVLLQVMEEGRLTDGRGNIARFSEAVVIMTSNIGSEHLMVRQITDDLARANHGPGAGFPAPGIRQSLG